MNLLQAYFKKGLTSSAILETYRNITMRNTNLRDIRKVKLYVKV